MKFIFLLIALFIFKSSISKNLFFQWRITDVEKAQAKEESLSLLQSYSDLFKKIFSNYKERNNIFKNTSAGSGPSTEEEEPTLFLSKYTHCQKCVTFLDSFRRIKEKYGFQNLYENFKQGICSLSGSVLKLNSKACVGYIENYGAIIVENIFTKYIENDFLCEKLDLCSSEIPKKYIDPDVYAKKIIEGKPKKTKEEVDKNGKVIKVLQITDLHLDLDYKEGANGECTYPICCREETNERAATDKTRCGKYGYEGKSDINNLLFDSFVEDASKRDIDFIIWTGDNAPHDGWVGYQDLAYNISEILRDKLNKKFRNGDKNIPIFYSLGNHEKYPFDAFHDDEEALLKRYGEIYKEYLDDAAYKDFREYGYYSMKYKDTNLRIIAINCLVCDSFNFNLFNSTKKHAKDMFTWLEKQLQYAEDNNEFVFILNHFPLNGGFTLTECGKRFQALFDRYEYTVRGIFSGHTHCDDIEAITEYFNKDKIININFIAPQLTTYENKLPSYRIYTIDEETKQVIDYEQFRFNLSRSNEEGKPYWFSVYKASKFYGVKTLLEYEKMINIENMPDYIYNRYSGAKIGEKNRNNEDKIKYARCVMTTNNFDEFVECYNPKFELGNTYFAIITNFLIGPFEED